MTVLNLTEEDPASSLVSPLFRLPKQTGILPSFTAESFNVSVDKNGMEDDS